MRQAVDARGQDGLHGRRNLDALDGAGEPVGAGRATEGTGVDEGAHALFEKEGVAAGTRHQQRLQRAEAGVVAQKRLEQSVGAVGGEGVEAELEIGALARPRMAVIGAVGHQEHDARRGHRIHQGVEQGLRLGVGPVQILDDHEQGLPLARADEQALDRIEHALAPLLRFQLQPPRVVDRRVEQGQERRQQGPEAHIKAEHGGGELLPHRGGGVIGLEQREAPEELDHRQVRGGAAVRSSPALEHAPAARALRAAELVHEPALADPGLADHGHDLAAPGPGLFEGGAEPVHLRLAPHEPREAAGRRSLEPRARPTGSHQLVDIHGRREAAHAHGAEGPRLHVALGEGQGVGGDEDRAGDRHLLHAPGEVGGLSHRRVVHMQVAADRAHDDLAGVDAHPHLDGHALSTPHLVGVAPHGFLQAQRRVARAHRVVLVGERGAEEGHDAISQHLVHGALVLVNGVHHEREDRVEKGARLLGIPVGEQLGRALEVGEEHGDLLALSFHRGPAGEDLLGDVGRRVHAGRGEARRSDRGRVDGLAALRAESPPGGDRRPAGRTGRGQPRPAVRAEPSVLGILCLAPRAGHAGPPRPRATRHASG